MIASFFIIQQELRGHVEGGPNKGCVNGRLPLDHGGQPIINQNDSMSRRLKEDVIGFDVTMSNSI